ncbi:hypothetical protein AB0L70_35785 [Kribbella sp. NPDC051952]|uniref:hypothetical protein n=1 Tax=Kribbella sp. NPDC051952 TaxID=3154851 RepID=UPI003422F3AF
MNLNAPNLYAPPPYAERIVRLALGVEPRDVARGGRALSPLRVTVEEHPDPLGAWRRWAPGEQLDDVLPALERHGTGRFARLLDDATGTTQRIRISDPRRRYVPRRFAVSIADEDAVVTAETDPTIPDIGPAARIFTPSLYPGAAAEVAGLQVRGRITRGGLAVRWARVRATLTSTGEVAGWAHADDRGEYLLPIANPVHQIGFTPDPVPVTLTAGYQDPAPVPPDDDPLRVVVDPLWDLPEEPVLALPVPDDPAGTVTDGRTFPTGFATHTFASIPLAQGRPHVVDLDLP